MVKNKLLTIAIPTYNRERYLKKCLDAICPQITTEVEVVVRDNSSSSYDFNKFIEPYSSNYGVKYYVNDVNVGMDANVARLFEKCETKWLWIIGDDDILLPDAVKLVLDHLSSSDATFVRFNSPIYGKFIGIEGFAEAMKPINAFGQSFFLSEGIHNAEQARKDLPWHYKALSTSIAQILRVMKHLSANKTDYCQFFRDPVLANHGQDISWVPINIVPYQLIVFDLFRNERRILCNNVFKEVARYSIEHTLNAKISVREKIHLINSISYKYGLWNTLRYELFCYGNRFFRIFIKTLRTTKK